MDNYDFKKIRLELIAESKRKIAASVKDDNLIGQAMNSISEIDKVTNVLSKRLREWYELYYPEISHKISDHENFIEKILSENFKKDIENGMGADLDKEDLEMILNLARKIETLYSEKENLIDYIKIKMQNLCPKLLDLCGPLIGGKLIAHKSSLRYLAFIPSSTIQLLGAEKALFRHLRSNARSPKYGFILNHPEVSSAKNKGRAARQFANKISMAVKQDYFSKEENRV